MRYLIHTVVLLALFPKHPFGQTNSVHDSNQIRITYLGTSGWEITDGKTIILIDPYLSRLRRTDTNKDDNRTIYSDSDLVVLDTVMIDKHIKKAGILPIPISQPFFAN